jgi:hypothetical protein
MPWVLVLKAVFFCIMLLQRCAVSMNAKKSPNDGQTQQAEIQNTREKIRWACVQALQAVP